MGFASAHHSMPRWTAAVRVDARGGARLVCRAMPPVAPILARRAALAAPLLALLPTGARAHALVIGSTPATGDRLQAAPSEVVVRFNSRLDHGRSQLLIAPQREGGGGTAEERRLELTEPSPPTELRAALPPLPPGPWRLRWQVLALDGHITRGDILFAVQG